jgi:hypothetical protein
MAVSNCAALTFLDMFYPHELYLFPSLNNPYAIPREAGKVLSLGFTVTLLWLRACLKSAQRPFLQPL